LRTGAVAVLALAALAAGAFAEGPVPARIVQEAYTRLSPALCLVSYSSEITDTSSGRTYRKDSSALGVIVRPDGLIITHGHMMSEESQPFNIRVTVGQGDGEREYEAQILTKPDDVNLCFLRIETKDSLELPSAKFDKGISLSLGEPLLILGIMGQSMDYERSVTFRYVGSILTTPRTTYCLDQMFNFGFVTGPVVNAQGQVVGLVGFDLAPEEGGDLYVRSGQPLVYQTALFAKYIENPPGEHTEDAESWLGVFTQPLTADLAAYWNLDLDGGVVVSTVVPGSPADAAGIQRGDVITGFAGTPVRPKLDREVVAFTKMVRETPHGQPVAIELYRNGQSQTVMVSLVPRPKTADNADEYKDTVFGLAIREITTDVRLVLNLSEDVEGVIVRRVTSGSPAEEAGMRPGLIILSVGTHRITGLNDYREALAAIEAERPAEVSVFCRAGSVTGFFRLQPRWGKEEQ